MVASVAVFMVSLDNLVVTTALPVIKHDLGAGLSGLEWTVNAYTLTFAVLLMTGAGLGDRFGRKRMFLTGLALFTFGSAVAAVAPSIDWLIAARALQGVGGAIVDAADADDPLRGGASGAPRHGAGHLGRRGRPGRRARPRHRRRHRRRPLLAVDLLGQRAHRPRPAARRLLPPERKQGPRPGARPARPGAHQQRPVRHRVGPGARQRTRLDERRRAAAHVAGALLVAGFVLWERRAAAPMVPLRFFRSRAFSAANLTTC